MYTHQVLSPLVIFPCALLCCCIPGHLSHFDLVPCSVAHSRFSFHYFPYNPWCICSAYRNIHTVNAQISNRPPANSTQLHTWISRGTILANGMLVPFCPNSKRFEDALQPCNREYRPQSWFWTACELYGMGFCIGMSTEYLWLTRSGFSMSIMPPSSTDECRDLGRSPSIRRSHVRS